jgi:prolyl-tRNA synthetase
VHLNIPILVDRDAAVLNDFVCGANTDGFHLSGVNWKRDCNYLRVEDMRNVVEGDLSPDGKGVLSIKRGIEVGHIFQLGNKYSKAMNAVVLDEKGRNSVMEMGCYGIGVSRIVAAAIEQCHDDKGIIWPDNIAPFHVAIIPLNAHKAPQVLEVCEQLYKELTAAGIEVLLDDRDKKTSPGVKFADMELIGIPHRLVVSDRGLEEGAIEYKHRAKPDSEMIKQAGVVQFLRDLIKY